MTAPSAGREPAMSIADANRRLLDDSRFALEDGDGDRRASRQWQSGPTTIVDIVALYRTHGDREFIVYENDRCTYAGAIRASETIASTLIKAGVQTGDRVALLMRNRVEWPACFIGALLAGAVVVPINGWALADELRHLLDDCQARFLFTDQDDMAIPSGIDQVWSIDGVGASALKALLGVPAEWNRLPAPTCAFPTPSPSSVAALFYTSGTTSKPKAAMVTHRALTATIKNAEFNAERVRLRFPPLEGAPVALTGQPSALFPVPLFHVTGAIPGLIGTSGLGAKIVLMRKWDVGEALRLIEREKINLLGGVPTMPLQLLADPRHRDYDLSSLVGCLYGGAPAPTRLPSAIAVELGAEASTGWGMTETASTLLHNTGAEYRNRPASCGAAVPVNDVRIASPDDLPLPAHQVGELQVRGLNVTQGYWNRPEDTIRSFTADGWFRTGDIATIDDEGFVTIVDRAKDIVIRGGENIACVEIEDRLFDHPAVIEAAVVGRAHSTLGEEPVAFVWASPGSNVSNADLRAFAALHIARHKVPAEIFIGSAPLPRNVAGKVDKKILRDRIA